MKHPFSFFSLRLAALALSALSTAPAAPTFSVPGFVDETVYQGNGMISMRFDYAGRLWVSEKQGRVLVFEPNKGGPSSYAYDYYETGELSALPDFTTLTPIKSGVVNSFTIEPRQRDDDFAFRYSGTIQIPTAGSYTFYLSSDDGSRLFIDNTLVVDRDGTHGPPELSGTTTLTAGTHAIRVEYFERAGAQFLTVQYSGPGIPKGPISQGLFKSPQVFADFSSQVNTDGERGMTGLTLDPDFEHNHYVYVLFATGNDQRILRLTSNATCTAMVPGSEIILLSGLPNANAVHKAGDLAFHPKAANELYVMLGDDGDRNLVGDLTKYNGKLLRINSADGKGLAGNPHYDGNTSSVASRVWSARFRNPFRFAFDPAVPINDVLYVSENGDATDRIAQIKKDADGGWDGGFEKSSPDGKRKILETSAPSKTAIAILRSGPLSPTGAPVLYNARYGGGDRNEVRRWTLTGPNLDTLTPIPADEGRAFFSGFTEHGIVSFTPGPDGSLYYTDSGQGPSLGANQRLGRIRFVGGVAPVPNFAASPLAGRSPLSVSFTDSSTAPGSRLSGWNWNFGDGATSPQQNPVHIYTQPGIYPVALVATNALGVNATKNATVTVYHETSLVLTGRVMDARSLVLSNLAVPTELRFYQSDGTTPLAFPGGTGAASNAVPIAAGGTINFSINVRITGPGIVVSAGESATDGVQPAFIGIPLASTLRAQSASVYFRLSDTMLRGRITDTRNAAAPVDLGIARSAPGSYYAFAGGRDFLPGANRPLSGVSHRTVPDALGYYHIPIPTGGGGATFYLDTSVDTLAASHGQVLVSAPIAAGTQVVQNISVGLYDGGAGEADLSRIAVTPNVNFNTQIQPFLTNYCAACHNGIATNSAGLDLQAGAALAALVGRESTEAPGVKRVQPGSPARSYLMEKINAALPQAGTSMRPGDPMPLAQRALIRDWISQLETENQARAAADASVRVTAPR